MDAWHTDAWTRGILTHEHVAYRHMDIGHVGTPTWTRGQTSTWALRALRHTNAWTRGHTDNGTCRHTNTWVFRNGDQQPFTIRVGQKEYMIDLSRMEQEDPVT
eukprot:238280-Amorphochlora_amoeboformis.AAC.1